MLAVLDAFIGDPFCCAGSGSPPECQTLSLPPIVVLDATAIQETPLGPIVAYEVEVHAYGFGTLRGYNIQIEATGLNADDIQLASITVEDTKPTYVFASTPSDQRVDAFDLANWRMMGALHRGGVNVRSYLATYRFEPAPGAPSSFTVTIQTKPETAVYDPNGCGDGPQMYPIELDF